MTHDDIEGDVSNLFGDQRRLTAHHLECDDSGFDDNRIWMFGEQPQQLVGLVEFSAAMRTETKAG